MKEQNIINSLHACCSSANETAIKTIMEREDLEEVCQTILNGFFESEATTEDLTKIIDILNYLENETDIPTTVSDTVYDQILEVLGDAKIMDIGTSESMGTDEGVKEHKYPELRGSLKKVHFATTDQIPKKDSRKSLEDFLRNTLQPFFEEYPDEPISIIRDYKWDGTSNVFECSRNQIKYALTRYKVKLNLGKDISHIYQDMSAADIFKGNIPSQIYTLDAYGVKTEIVMSQENFNAYKEYAMDTKCNRRSAVSGILNRTTDNFDPRMLDFLEPIPLQISTEKLIPGDPDVILSENKKYIWRKMGIINGRFQYIGTREMEYGSSPSFVLTADILAGYHNPPYFAGLAKDLYDMYRDELVESAEKYGYPIDGMVFTLDNAELVKRLGRSDDRNNFQVAFKFPAGYARTTLLDVEFQVGPIAGSITPVANVLPVRINGSTISHIGLSNMEKLERLDLHKGDEIIVQYDIIPKIIVDDTCKKSGGEKIEPVTKCPVCGGDINKGRCVNPNCDAKLAGSISNYVTKMNIPGFGMETIITLVNRGILHSIKDLYRLSQVRSEMLAIPGFQEKTVSNLVSAPLSQTNIYPHELLGSIGIPDISLATMEKLCRVMDLDVIVNTPEVLLSLYQGIDGIGEITAIKIVEGIKAKVDIIKTLIPYFTFKKYGETIGNVVFTDIRDPDFATFLRDNPGIRTSSSVTKDTIAVITPDDPKSETGSMKDAKKKNVPILAITEAKDKWGYEKG